MNLVKPSTLDQDRRRTRGIIVMKRVPFQNQIIFSEFKLTNIRKNKMLGRISINYNKDYFIDKYMEISSK